MRIDDLRDAARRSLPPAIYDFLAGGAEDELALDRNRAALDAVKLAPRALRGSAEPDPTTRILGQPSALPFGLAPAGLAGLVRPGGELAIGRAAAAAGIPYAVSAMSSVPLEAVAAATPGPRAFQLYMLRDRAVVEQLLDRAAAAGYGGLILTVDSQISGLRERDLRNGLTIPPRLRPGVLLDGLRRPGWSARFLRAPAPTFANLDRVAPRSSIVAYVARELDPGLDWSTLEWLRERWPGHLTVKGILRAEDARAVLAAGAEAIVVSNHGGRQVDAAPAPIEALPAILAAVGGELEVLVDSGIRRGADVIRALALGADGCLVGRPYLYGLAAGGEAGVARAIEILAAEIRRLMTLLGIAAVGDAGPDLLYPG